VGHADSLYFATQSGQIFAIAPDAPDKPRRLGLERFRPVRGLGFTKNGTLYAVSYEAGVHRVLRDTLVAMPKMGRTSWALTMDNFDRIWLAGRQGVFRQEGDTLIKITPLSEAYDVDFYRNQLVVAHRGGISLYDSVSGVLDTTYCSGTIFWTIDVFDSVLVAGGVEQCALITGRTASIFHVGPAHNIPWAFARDSTGAIILGTQKGLFRLHPGTHTIECIGFKGKCIKSVFIDRAGRLWVGTYFRE
jgi:hypothetical protein